MNPKDSERLSRYLDGELTPNETREVEAWLETSPEAREEYATMKQIHETTLDILPQTRFSRPSVAVRRRRPFLRLAAAAAIVVLFGGVVFGAVQVYEAFVAETATTVNPPPDAPPPAPEEAVAPSVIVDDSSGEPTAESVLLASEDAPSEPAATESPVSLDELSAPPLTGGVTKREWRAHLGGKRPGPGVAWERRPTGWTKTRCSGPPAPMPAAGFRWIGRPARKSCLSVRGDSKVPM